MIFLFINTSIWMINYYPEKVKNSCKFAYSVRFTLYKSYFSISYFFSALRYHGSVLRERKCVIMIQPVMPYSCRTGRNFKGTDSKDVNCKGGKIPKASIPLNRAFEKKLAVLNAGGISAAAGVVTTVIARSYTATWKNAGLLGLGAGFVTMMFICPILLYKSGFNLHKKPQQNQIA